MKTIVKILLILAIIGLGYVTVMSIERPIHFNKVKVQREKPIIKRLMDIRTAQIEYKARYGKHAANFQELEDFLKNGRIPTVLKQGQLTEKQLEDGLTEEKAVAIIEKAVKTDRWKDAKNKGLVYDDGTYFRRDTTWSNAGETLFGSNFAIDSLGIVPGTSDSFEMDTASVKTNSGFAIAIFEAQVPYTVYLKDQDKAMLRNLVDEKTKLERYPGLKVGSLTEVNNYAGNWESEY